MTVETLKLKMGAIEMAQQASLITLVHFSRTIWWKERADFDKVSSDPHMYPVVCMVFHRNMLNT